MASPWGSRAAGDLSPQEIAAGTFQRRVYTSLALVEPVSSFSVPLTDGRSHRYSVFLGQPFCLVI